MATQIAGNSGTIWEVEPTSRAGRVVLRADDPGSLGWYRIAATNGTTVMTAGLAAASDIFQWRNGNASNLIIIRKIEFSAGSVLAFTAGAAYFNLFRATTFSANGTGGATFLPAAQNKLRTSFGSSLMTAGNNSDIRCATTVALGAGTKTNDTIPFGSIQSSIPATAGTPITPGKVNLLEQRGWEYPLTLVQNEGFSIQATVPATGTWFFEVDILWEEQASY